MCEFCTKHGEGKKWYLQAKNYSEDLLSDLRRRRFIADFAGHPEHLAKNDAQAEQFSRLPPFVRSVVGPVVSNRQKKVHFGQVLPIEDVEQIFGFVTSVVRLACMCRHVRLAGQEHRYCYGLSMAPKHGRFGQIVREVNPAYLIGPQTGGVEELSAEAAIAHLRQLEKEGLCHTVWTFVTPFVGAICNCDRSDCIAMRTTVAHGLPVMFRAEYVAGVNPDLCNGCRQCLRVCQFGALTYSAAQKKAVIHSGWCYGCGICRASCTKNAITLSDRRAVPAAAKLW